MKQVHFPYRRMRQVTAVTRNNYHVREEFVGFYECEDGVTGQVMATLVMKAVQELGLSMDYCKGQCYDGAGNL